MWRKKFVCVVFRPQFESQIRLVFIKQNFNERIHGICLIKTLTGKRKGIKGRKNLPANEEITIACRILRNRRRIHRPCCFLVAIFSLLITKAPRKKVSFYGIDESNDILGEVGRIRMLRTIGTCFEYSAADLLLEKYFKRVFDALERFSSFLQFRYTWCSKHFREVRTIKFNKAK